MVFDSLRKVFTSDDATRERELEDELARVAEGLERRRGQLEEKRATRLEALYPQGPVEGSRQDRYPDLAPLNFEDGEAASWLVAVSKRIIDAFPGGEGLLSQLDHSLRAHADANFFRVVPDGPYDRLLAWRDEILTCWDLPELQEVPIYVAQGGGARVLGCKQPLVVLDAIGLAALGPEEERFLLASTLGHLFFGNLRLFAFHKLMSVLDQLPSMTGYLTKGLRVIPVVGNTLAGGIQIAQEVNNNVIRKTQLLARLRQYVLCDRLACHWLGNQDAAQHYFTITVLGSSNERVTPRLIEQGREVQEKYERGEIDAHMLSLVGPAGSAFAAWRAYKLDAWFKSPRFGQLRDGYYVTRERLKEYRRSHKVLEDEIVRLETRIVELHERQVKLQGELAELLTRAAEAQRQQESDSPAE